MSALFNRPGCSQLCSGNNGSIVKLELFSYAYSPICILRTHNRGSISTGKELLDLLAPRVTERASLGIISYPIRVLIMRGGLWRFTLNRHPPSTPPPMAHNDPIPMGRLRPQPLKVMREWVRGREEGAACVR